MDTSDVEKIMDLDEQNLDVEGNNNKRSTLDKEEDIQRNNLNCKISQLNSCVKILNV